MWVHGLNVGAGDGVRESWIPPKVLDRAAGCVVGPFSIIESKGRMTDLMGKDEFIFIHVDIKVSVEHLGSDV